MSSEDHRAHLDRFVSRLDRRLDRLENRSRGFSRARLAVFLLGVAATFFAFRGLESSAEWLVPLAFSAVFLWLVRCHETLIAGIRRHQVYREIKHTHIARILREWEALPPAGVGPRAPEHPFAADLDLLGDRSLHRLLDTSFSRGGSNRLADWLTETDPSPIEAEEKQRLVYDLLPFSSLRDRIALLSAVTSGEAGGRFDGEVLLRWLARHSEDKNLLPVLRILFGLAATTAVLVVLQIFGVMGAWWALSLTGYAAVYLLNGGLYAHLFDEAEHLHYELEYFRPVVVRLERFHAPTDGSLAELLRPFQQANPLPSDELRRVMWLAVAASAQKSEVLRLVLNVLLPWDLFFTYLLARFKGRLSDVLPLWLDTVYTLEAAASLSTYAALNPESTFPTFTEAAVDQEVLAIHDLGHPLIPRDRVVRNDFSVQRSGHVTLVTGSNMSGKSTFLRAVGLSVVMARAGGPVDATSCRMTPWRLFCSMGVQDSVTDGISFFYAEVRRLGALMRGVAQHSDYSAMVLIDEIFRGTNNRERYEGSSALLKHLVQEDCVGLIATHDLDLVKLSDESPDFDNRHFREEVRDGRMVFDFKLRSGPCPTTNALEIMRTEGLPIPGERAPTDVGT